MSEGEGTMNGGADSPPKSSADGFLRDDDGPRKKYSRQFSSTSQIGPEFVRLLERMAGVELQRADTGPRLLDSTFPSLRVGDEDEGWPGEEDDEKEINWERLEYEWPPPVGAALQTLLSLQTTIELGPRWKLEEYVTSVDLLLAVRQVMIAHGCDKGAREANVLVDVATDHLEEEFEEALQRCSKAPDGPALRAMASYDSAKVVCPGIARPSSRMFGSSEENSALAAEVALKRWLLAGVVPFIQKMALGMQAAGAGRRCTATYRKVRADGLDLALGNLQLESALENGSESATWPLLDEQIKTWNQDFAVLINIFLVGEGALLEVVLDGFEGAKDECFEGMLADSKWPQALRSHLQQGKAIVRRRCFPERLFALLDMYSTVLMLTPKVITHCPASHLQVFESTLHDLPLVLADGVLATFAELRRVLESTAGLAAPRSQRFRLPWRTLSLPAEDALPEGGVVHPTTSYVVNFIKVYAQRNGSPDYGSLLDQILEKRHVKEFSRPSMESETRLLMQSLCRSLEARAASSPDVALKELFLMNNFNHIYRQLSDQRALRIALPDWETDELVKIHAQAFQEAALGKVVGLLTEGPSPLTGGGVEGVQDCTKRLKRFNAAFEELALQQGSWVIPDEDCRRRIRQEWSTALTAAYSGYLMKYKVYISEVPSKRYSADRLGVMVMDLFFLGTQL